MSRAGEGTTDQQHYRDGHFLVRDDLRLHYRDYPGSADRSPLLCLPGLTRNARDFEAFAERYSPNYRVLALDFRGRGESEYDPVPARYVPLTYAGDVLEFLDQLSIREAIFVGTSLGGLVTMSVAAISPDRISAAILNDVGPDLSKEGLDRIRSYVGKGLHLKSWDEAADVIAENNNHVPASFTKADWARMAHRLCRERDGELVFDYDPAIALPFNTAGPTPIFDLWPLFAALAQKPLLVIRGEKSDLLTGAAAERMRSVASKAKFAIVTGVGHAPELDEPEAIASIEEFLNGLGRT
jgi:pimeloyl-ACP methyl ester carboxylesterase